MTPEQIAQLRGSLALLAEEPGQLADDFFFCLFRLDPSLRLVIQRPTGSGSDGLYKIVEKAVGSLGRRDDKASPPPKISDQLNESLGLALFWSVRLILRERFTPSMERAWLAAWPHIAPRLWTAMERPTCRIAYPLYQ